MKPLVSTFTIICKHIFSHLFIEPVLLHGEGDYNLNVIKDVKVTESFLSLSEEDRGCQNKEHIDNCTTRYLFTTVLKSVL